MWAELKRYSKRNSQIKQLENKIIYKIPARDLFDQLSTFDFKEIYLEHIDIKEKSLKISGLVVSTHLTTAFTSYIKQLKQMPYLQNINYQTKKRR